jgi:hypothetical protein
VIIDNLNIKRMSIAPPEHRSHIEAIAVRLYKFVGLTDLPRTGFRMHRHFSTPVTPLDSRVHKKLGSPKFQSFECQAGGAATKLIEEMNR